MSEGEFGVSSIERVACKASLLTEIFSMRSAILAFATRPSQPRNSDAVANLKALTDLAKPLNPTDDFMAGNQGKFWIGQLAINNVQIGSTYGTRRDAYEHFPWIRISDWHRTSRQRPARGFEDHRVHGSFSRKMFRAATPGRLVINHRGHREHRGKVKEALIQIACCEDDPTFFEVRHDM